MGRLIVLEAETARWRWRDLAFWRGISNWDARSLVTKIDETSEERCRTRRRSKLRSMHSDFLKWQGQVVTICENSWCFELSSQYFYRIRAGNFSKRGFIRLGEVWLAKWMAKHFAYQRSQFHPLDGNHRHSWKLYGICMGPQNGSKWMLNLRFHWRCGEESQSDWTFSRFSTGRLLTLKGLCGPKVPGG